MTADVGKRGTFVAEVEGMTPFDNFRTMNTHSRGLLPIVKALRHVLSVAAVILLTACQLSGPASPDVAKAVGRPTDVTPAA